MSNLSKPERRLRAQMGAHAMHARNDPKKVTKKARAGFVARFERQVDPDGALEPAERARRAHHAMAAHMAGLSLKAASAKRKKAQRRVAEVPEEGRLI